MSDEKNSLALFSLIGNKLKFFLKSIVPPDEVEDIVQETYIKVWLHQKKNSRSINKSFVYTIARNLAFDYLRKPASKYNESVEEEDDFGTSGQDSTFNQVSSDEQFLRFCQAVQQLPQQCRKVFIMKKVYGLSTKEISDELDISKRTVEVHLHRGYMKFQAIINEQKLNEENSLQPVKSKGV